MRDIEFRAKRIDNNKWVYGSYVFYKDFDEEENHLIFSKNGNPNNIIPETVGQFTGLCDKNGKKIFEGDIVRNNEKEKFVIEFDNEICCFVATSINYASLQYSMKQEFEVIGNIYENKELEEQENE